MPNAWPAFDFPRWRNPAAKGGTVVLSTYSSSLGNHIAISHPDGSRILYAHMSALLVSVGDTISQGQVIGRGSSIGNSIGNHLHFEVWTNNSSGSQVNPMDTFLMIIKVLLYYTVNWMETVKTDSFLLMFISPLLSLTHFSTFLNPYPWICPVFL